ncbi:carbohydrate ABC transporter substrate-binding protein, CUT1 family (TC 3.A.1.1.-) [Palleronia marisminoris]|uniref:Probable sugar-binding periplasmic protein n=1 Tax=Palleronia marisminoris TaxID=315423 RepID=A0A1Y5S4E7_9RHOB|nr:ABC transporter substrate-binding protein [Palleronia marisminoris]SFG63072.1 carbohydrate ABC transporter substrate-binding protein, CUT1 family (TC 3.A.1.1.-) [Palleronia marisminoris]SLN32119.1 Multiple sugar-binding protein precursor [Palleronia marisminoris]
MKHIMMKTTAAAALCLAAGGAIAQEVTLTIESWRAEDQAIWDEVLIPAFEEQHPDINLEFTPTAPTEYNAALNARLEGGTAGDLITCRPFDGSLPLFQRGQLADITDLEGLSNFPDFAKAAWSTDDGAQVFCVPMASVIHGFIYNADAFTELGLEEPKTVEEFFAVLDAIKEDGTYIPLALGSADQWEAAQTVYTNIGPTYWKGEEGRQALIDGTAEFTDEEFVAPYEQMARWSDYMGDAYQAQGYSDSQNLFTLGRAAIYPAGSWEITGFTDQAFFEMGAFPPPVSAEGDTCYISDHTDIGVGMNASTDHPEAARTFLDWAASAEFAELYTLALPGFFSLSNAEFAVENPLAQEFLSFRQDCESTVRVAAQILSRGEPNLENEMWVVSANVLNETMTPQEAAAEMQQGLESWYEPQQD